MMAHRVFSTVLIAIVAASPAAAQVARFEDLADHLNLGDSVSVVDTGGARWRGLVVELTADQIVLGADSRDIALAAADVRRISACCDSLKSGALIGAISGGVVGFLGGYGFADNASVGGRAADGAVLAALFGGMFAGVGVGIDALIPGERVVYVAEGPTVGIAADPVRRTLGVRVTWNLP